MVVIYFDCVGVLNQGQSDKLDGACVARLANIAKTCNAKLICISEWRKGYSKKLSNCSKDMLMVIKALANRGVELYDVTPDLSKHFNSGAEQHELNHSLEMLNSDNYIVLSTNSFNDKCYVIDKSTGITDKDVKRIKKLLN